MTYAGFLSRLHRVHRRGDQADAQCPAHTDRTSNSLSVGVDQGGRILIKCFAGCTAEAVVGELGLTLSDLFPKGGWRNLDGVGLTLAELAVAKRLPVDFLKDLGVADRKHSGAPVVLIPYYGEAGGEIAPLQTSDGRASPAITLRRSAQPTKGAVSAPKRRPLPHDKTLGRPRTDSHS